MARYQVLLVKEGIFFNRKEKETVEADNVTVSDGHHIFTDEEGRTIGTLTSEFVKAVERVNE